MKREHVEATAVACPKCAAEIGAPCVEFGTLTGEKPWGPFSGTHRARQHLADETVPALAKVAKSKPTEPACRCANHLGHPKAKYPTSARALAWAARSPRVRGMRMEPYRCPTSNAWHVRTARVAV